MICDKTYLQPVLYTSSEETKPSSKSEERRCLCKLYYDICHSCLIMWYVCDATELGERQTQIICIIIANLLGLFELQLGGGEITTTEKAPEIRV